ncbi:hypothetical protein EDB84DRAFT_1580504 [Lactarius hengduanensis]|nr:hypothetical protein EDB84DRAFT_1580504 [Lactarius hengduanensis]
MSQPTTLLPLPRSLTWMPPLLLHSISEPGIYPAVDPLDSKSQMLDPRIVFPANMTLSESAFYMAGTIEDVKSKAEQLALSPRRHHLSHPPSLPVAPPHTSPHR